MATGAPVAAPPAGGRAAVVRVVPFCSPEAGLVTLDLCWRYIAANEAATAALKKTGECLIGHVVWDLFPECRDTPLGSLMRDVMLSRTAGEIRTPAHGLHDQDVISRVLPDTASGGIQMVFRFVARRDRRDVS